MTSVLGDEIVSAEEYAEKVKVWLYQAYQANVISSGKYTSSLVIKDKKKTIRNLGIAL